jgi:hypothetical protein
LRAFACVRACVYMCVYVYCGGVRRLAPEKSLDLGDSSPAPRALIYVASLRILVDHHRDDQETTDRTRMRDQGWVAAVKIERMERLLD